MPAQSASFARASQGKSYIPRLAGLVIALSVPRPQCPPGTLPYRRASASLVLPGWTKSSDALGNRRDGLGGTRWTAVALTAPRVATSWRARSASGWRGGPGPPPARPRRRQTPNAAAGPPAPPPPPPTPTPPT